MVGDETWCFQYEPLTKRQSAVWKSPEDSPPRKVRQQKSKVKTMLITFFDSEGMIHKEFVPKRSAVNGQYFFKKKKFLDFLFFLEKCSAVLQNIHNDAQRIILEQ